MWEFISEALFLSLPPKVQLGCLAVVVVLIGCAVLVAYL
jgi:hypothetical protein